MHSIRLLTIEDENPESIYDEIHAELSKWLFVKKKLVKLESPGPDENPWVKSLEEWRSVIGPISARNELTFCTVDLQIPESPDSNDSDVRHGITLLHELQARGDPGLRCCILTGRSKQELEQEFGQEIPDVLFDFKEGAEPGFPNVTSYIRSQSLSLIDRLEFTDSEGENHIVLLDEESGQLRDHFLSKAVYFSNAATWHIPILTIGNRGLGSRTLLKFVAYLADARILEIDLRANSSRANRETYRQLQSLVRGMGQDEGDEMRLICFYGLDEYDPDKQAELGESCLKPMEQLLKALEQAESLRTAVAFSVSGDSRLRISSSQTRGFIRHLEETIARMTDFPLQHLGMDENGWTVGHPRILHLPSLRQRGKPFIHRVVQAHLEKLQEKASELIPGYHGEGISLADDVVDLIEDKTDWSKRGGLAGLRRTLSMAFESFVENRAEEQFEVTRFHLNDEAREWMRRIVLNMDNVQLEFPKKGGNTLQVIDKADFQVEKGELLVILGPSGCGKTQLLRLFAGLLRPTAGRVFYRREEIRGPSEKLGMVFQDYSLFPWLTVRENIAFGPKNRGVSPETVFSRIEDLIEVSQLTDFKDAFPAQLSGGMRQRVAIVRALANTPDVLLMDEPFGALDPKIRGEMQEFLLATKARTKTTIVFVTHDIDEAVLLGDRIYIASPRPLRLGQCFVVPFSLSARRESLRRDPAFGTLVNTVRDALLEAASVRD